MIRAGARRALAAAGIAVFVCAPAWASKPVYFELEGRPGVEKGSAEGISIAENGAIALAPAFQSVYDTGQTYVWSSAADQAGTVYLGTGHEGRVYAVDAGGKGRQVLDTEELDVTALAVDGAGGLFVATSPDGRIYRVTRDGASSVYFDPEDKYIWALAFRDNVLYAGTGEKGIIYRVTAAGKGEPWVDSDEVHIISLAFTARGELLAGTDPGALVLRIGADGKPFTLFDSPLQETHAVRVAPDGAVFALMIASSAATTASEQTSVTVVESATTTASAPDIASIGASEVKGRRDTSDAKSVVYRIAPDGTTDVVWNSKSVVGYALHVAGDRVLVGTGDRGRIIAIDPLTADATVLVQSTEDQTSTFVTVGPTVYATSNTVGKLFRLGPGTAARGTYEAPVHDAKSVSQWGRLSMRGATGVATETRSGNTETPDSTWSAWQPVRVADGAGAIPSPPARYIQWRLALTGEGARAQAVAISYLPRNVAPEVTLLAVLPTGIGLQETPQQPIDPGILSSGFEPSIFGLSANLPPRRVYQEGARSLIWQAKDPDDERLAYSIFYRALNETAWHPLAVGLTNAYFTIDSDALPDGIYLFRVVADDSPSNPTRFVLSGERLADPAEVDNTPPVATAAKPAVTGDDVDVVFSVADMTSRVVRGAYSLDGGPWQPVYPEDGIADSANEVFRVRVPALAPGEHSVAFRAADANLNVGSSKVTVTIR
jgi:hypothetical protein